MGKAAVRILSIAGSDSGGGAGIQADLKTFSALGCFGMSAITAVTAQNTREVRGVWQLPLVAIRKQIEAVLDDIGADAVKIGMLGDAATVSLVADLIKQYRVYNVVLDPVMIAKSGDRLLSNDAISVLISHLLPHARIVTPNVPEAEAITGMKIKSAADMERAGFSLLERGISAALIKGGHQTDGPGDDVLCLKGVAPIWLATKRIVTSNTHGTGCTLASAIAAFLGKGLDLAQAVKEAKSYVQSAIEEGANRQIGMGHGPIEHFFAWNR